MKGMLIPTNGNPVEIDIEVDEAGSTLHDLQRLVGGNIEPFDVIFGEGISLYVNEEGLFTCPPNRAVYATKGMEEAGYLSMIREYENSVAMPEGERVTYLDPRGGVHLKDGDDKVPDYMGHAVKCAEYLRFGDEVDAVTCGEYPRSSAVKFCDTPELFVQAGFRPLPMLYTQRHLRDAIRPKSSYDPHRHGLTVEQMKRLPELMEHPVMLCDSPARDDTMLVVLRDVDCDDLPLIMAVRPDGRGYYEAGEIETNFILAVYGRTNFPRYFDNLITPDRVVYYDEERGRELNALAKLHLLRSHIVEPDLNKTIIRRPQCIVKSETAGQEGYRLESKAKEARDSSAKLASEHDSQMSRDSAIEEITEKEETHETGNR